MGSRVKKVNEFRFFPQLKTVLDTTKLIEARRWVNLVARLLIGFTFVTSENYRWILVRAWGKQRLKSLINIYKSITAYFKYCKVVILFCIRVLIGTGCLFVIFRGRQGRELFWQQRRTELWVTMLRSLSLRRLHPPHHMHHPILPLHLRQGRLLLFHLPLHPSHAL